MKYRYFIEGSDGPSEDCSPNVKPDPWVRIKEVAGPNIRINMSDFPKRFARITIETEYTEEEKRKFFEFFEDIFINGNSTRQPIGIMSEEGICITLKEQDAK